MAQTIKFRRGTATQLTSIYPEQGEPCFTTDTKKLYIGDGITPGGVLQGGSFTSAPLTGIYSTVLNSGDIYQENDTNRNIVHIGNGVDYGGFVFEPGIQTAIVTPTINNYSNTVYPILDRYLVLPATPGFYYKFTANLILGHAASTGEDTRYGTIYLYGGSTSYSSATVSRLNSIVTSNLPPSGYSYGMESTAGAIILPGGPSGASNRSLVHWEGYAQILGAGVSYASGTDFLGIGLLKDPNATTNLSLRRGSTFSIQQLKVANGVPPKIMSLFTGPSTVVSSGQNITGYASTLYSATIPASTDYFWQANGINIIGASGISTNPQQGLSLTVTGFATGTILTFMVRAYSTSFTPAVTATSLPVTVV